MSNSNSGGGIGLSGVLLIVFIVLRTIENLWPIWDRLSIYLPGIASIDGGTTLQKFIKENKLNIYQPIEK